LYKIEWRDSEIMLLLQEFDNVQDLRQEPHVSVGMSCIRRGFNIELYGPLLHDKNVQIRVLDRNGIEIPEVRIERNGQAARFKQLDRDLILQVFHGRSGEILEAFSVVAPARDLPGPPPVWISSSQDLDWQRLESLYRELLDSPPGNWKQLAQRMGPGLVRCLLLQRLGARIPNPYNTAVELGQGRFSDHFPRYWKQLNLIYPSLRQAPDWNWASAFLVPPASASH
jgi:hypothetical protein